MMHACHTTNTRKMMCSTITIDNNVHLHACTEDIDTVVQSIDDKDYIVAVTPCGTKYWELFHDASKEDDTISEIAQLPLYVPMIAPPPKHTTKAKPRKVPVKSACDEQNAHAPKRGRPRTTCSDKQKKPKQPTAYNLFLQEKLAELRILHPSQSNSERMKAAAKEWQEFKATML